MIRYPLEFKAHAEASAGIHSTWQTSAAGGNLNAAIPPEFAGPGGGFSPEDLYLLAALNCFVATFTVFAEKSSLKYQSLTGEGLLRVDRNEQGSPWMAALRLRFVLQGTPDREKALRLLEKTSRSCIVLGSLKSALEFEFEVNA